MAKQKQNGKKQNSSRKIELLLAKYTSDYIKLIDEKEIAENKINKAKQTIIKLLKNTEDGLFEFEESQTFGIDFKHRFKLFKTTRINYDIDKLKEKLTKGQKKKLIKKNVSISDFQSFSEIMKQHGIKFSEIEPTLSILEKVDTKQLENMYEVGEIDLTEISDCYEVNTSYSLRHTVLEKNNNG